MNCINNTWWKFARQNSWQYMKTFYESFTTEIIHTQHHTILLRNFYQPFEHKYWSDILKYLIDFYDASSVEPSLGIFEEVLVSEVSKLALLESLFLLEFYTIRKKNHILSSEFNKDMWDTTKNQGNISKHSE